MINSRVLRTLIRLNHVTKLSTVVISQPKNRFTSLKVDNLGKTQFRKMATQCNIEKELDDPSRNHDYNQLLKKKEQKDVVLIDVREHSEINETGKLPGSIHIPLGEVQNALGSMSPEDFKKAYGAEKPQKNQELIFSCKAGIRSKKALKIALELDYNKASHYTGGFLDWAKNNPK